MFHPFSLCPAACTVNGALGYREDCDDGDETAGNGCENDCTVTPGYLCTDEVGEQSSCYPCSDGVINTLTEECDDGNAQSEDGCSSTCDIETDPLIGKYTCVGEPSVCSLCGNGEYESS